MTVLDTDRAAELADLRDAVREVCRDAGGPAAVRALPAGGPGWDPALWDVLGRQVGLAGLCLPERAGGGGGLAELTTVCEELGRALLPVPFLTSTVLAGQVLAAAGADALVTRVADGTVAALGVTGPRGVWDPAAVELTAVGGTVRGVLPVVPGAGGAQLLVVAARSAEGVDLYAVEAGPGVDTVPLDSLDLSRPSAAVTLTGAPATRLTSGGTAGAAVVPALDVAGVALAAEQLGGAAACLEASVAYLGERRQFGRPIGSFQALKHTCADLLVLVESCRSAVTRALDAEGSPDAMAEAAAVAQAWCSEAYRTVSAENVQLHGGIGFTWEHDAHLYFRRARADAVLLGGAAHHRERLAQLLGW
ncbi:acyl-CoA dehydrogenase [Modestobacter sp. I12A-02628]|uniref:Acyl-CoA/acyl-ACP dehydrogenase n=1 Tax=Goekera deserti TaxID=2497753 RepID=A0A7K3WHT6_9ACTN|nr:acyl-CoA dehydrogenase family protein [Goekera deserti]MPQ96544.1 acyl-CoA dehydrogenase [Goekera deserti]NDI47143.1 acyl-CoA dehydrogenase [Goekera deserti]NEL55459.1 acyl-CoA/acyl-ACP dehydrogenase [Goekera deserti]